MKIISIGKGEYSIDIHPDGDIYLGKKGKMKYLGFITCEEYGDCCVPVPNPLARKLAKVIKEMINK